MSPFLVAGLILGATYFAGFLATAIWISVEELVALYRGRGEGLTSDEYFLVPLAWPLLVYMHLKRGPL